MKLKKNFETFFGLVLVCCIMRQTLGELAPNAASALYASGLSHDQCCQANTILVVGHSSQQVDPDTATISVRFEVTQSSAEQAVQSAGDKAQEIIDTVTQNQGSQDDVQTTSFYISPEYDFSNGTSTIVGYSINQYIGVKVNNITDNEGKTADYIDKLLQIQGVILSGLSFSKENQTQELQRARELAFEDAKEKAQQYANLIGRDLGQVISIQDHISDHSAPLPPPTNGTSGLNQSGQGQQSQQVSILPPPIQITYRLILRYAFEENDNGLFDNDDENQDND